MDTVKNKNKRGRVGKALLYSKYRVYLGYRIQL